jgi:glycosyltransferase involved in cell wall biosynthesis
LLFPKAYPPGIRGKVKFILQKQTLQKVTHVITDSKTSKADIVKYLDYPQEKISVIYLAPANDRSTKTPKDEVIEKYHLPPRFILYVGDINYNKNVLGLISACKLINIPLVIVGKQAVSDDYDATHTENQPLVELIRRYGKDTDIIRLGFIEEANLKTIYQLAAVYCQPSFYEGFGLPVLEAMSHGCPVVAANTGSLPEICGGAAIMCKPTSTSIAEALHKTLQDENLRQNLIA